MTIAESSFVGNLAEQASDFFLLLLLFLCIPMSNFTNLWNFIINYSLAFSQYFVWFIYYSERAY